MNDSKSCCWQRGRWFALKRSARSHPLTDGDWWTRMADHFLRDHRHGTDWTSTPSLSIFRSILLNDFVFTGGAWIGWPVSLQSKWINFKLICVSRWTLCWYQGVAHEVDDSMNGVKDHQHPRQQHQQNVPSIISGYTSIYSNVCKFRGVHPSHESFRVEIQMVVELFVKIVFTCPARFLFI